jgi:hypothetical protein
MVNFILQNKFINNNKEKKWYNLNIKNKD